MDPITRRELYLAKIEGQDVEIPEPITREEHYLYDIAMNGGGGGGGGTKDYNSLLNKPQIEGHTLEGNMSLSDIGDTPIADADIISIVNSAFADDEGI